MDTTKTTTTTNASFLQPGVTAIAPSVLALLAANAGAVSDECLAATIEQLQGMRKMTRVRQALTLLRGERLTRKIARQDTTYGTCAGCDKYAYLGDDITCQVCKGYAPAASRLKPRPVIAYRLPTTRKKDTTCQQSNSHWAGSSPQTAP